MFGNRRHRLLPISQGHRFDNQSVFSSASRESGSLQSAERLRAERQNRKFKGIRATIPDRGIVVERFSIWRAGAAARYYFDESLRNGRPYLYPWIPGRASRKDNLPT